MSGAAASKVPVLAEELAIRFPADAIVCGLRTAAFARRAGLSCVAAHQAAIAASELASNVLKYAREGMLRLFFIDDDEPRIELVVQDEGPGIEDLASALADGYSAGHPDISQVAPDERKGLGIGLGAVQRLMDSVVFESLPHAGLRVVARKYCGRRR